MKRQIKRAARRYLSGDLRGISRHILAVVEEGAGNNTYVRRIVVGDRLYREIYRQALAKGWDGYWLDHPLILEIQDADGERPGAVFRSA